MKIPVDVKNAITRCQNFMDFPTAWAIQRNMHDSLMHDEKCSSVPGWHPFSGPAFLCDCGAVETQWRAVKNALEENVP